MRSTTVVLSGVLARSIELVLSCDLARSVSLVLFPDLAVMPGVLTPAFHCLGLSVNVDLDLASRLWRWPCTT